MRNKNKESKLDINLTNVIEEGEEHGRDQTVQRSPSGAGGCRVDCSTPV